MGCYGSPVSDDFRKRYMTEPLLCSMVDMQLEALLHGDLTPQDLARSAVLAATLYAERYQVPCVVVIGDPGLPDWKPALGDIFLVSLMVTLAARFVIAFTLDPEDLL